MSADALKQSGSSLSWAKHNSDFPQTTLGLSWGPQFSSSNFSEQISLKMDGEISQNLIVGKGLKVKTMSGGTRLITEISGA